MKTIKIKFVDFPYIKGDPRDYWLCKLLSKYYNVELSDHPDYIIDGGLGRDFYSYDGCIKIALIGENYAPDFNEFDYAMAFDSIEFGDRYLRMPLFATYPSFKKLECRNEFMPKPEELLNRGFCSFVVSRSEDPLRAEFFHKLSKYKQVASGGRMLNNVGGPVPDKLAFCSKYKFNIAFENSCVRGYTTEKVMEPLSVYSVPIYYGNPDIADDFNTDCMVHIANKADIDKAIEEIIALDKDDDAYLKKVMSPITALHTYDWYEERLVEFLRHIFDQPVDRARRLGDYGYQVGVRRRARRMWKLYLTTHPAMWGKTLKKKFGH